MAMKSLEELRKLISVLGGIQINSYEALRTVYNNFTFNQIINSSDFMKLLKIDLTCYLDYLFDDTIPYHYYKKTRLEEMTNDKEDAEHYYSLYMLALIVQDDNCYRNLPLLIKALINKLDIDKYKYVTKEDIASHIYKYYDLKDGYDLNISKDVAELKYKSKKDIYDKYDKGYDPNRCNGNDTEQFWIWAEHRTYDDELHITNNSPYRQYVTWVSRYYGDGYGFDILSIDLNTGKEKLIEVKSGAGEAFTLTDNEVRVMRNCKFKNAEYYIHKWTYNKETNTIRITRYKYDSMRDMIVDEYNNYYKLEISQYSTFTSYGKHDIKYELVKFDLVDEYNKQKILEQI